MLEVTLILSVLSLVLSSLSVFAVFRKSVLSEKQEDNDETAVADDIDEDENEEEDEDEDEEKVEEDEVEDLTFLGFPTQQIAETAVARLGVQNFNVSCVYCKAKKPAWDVVACSSLPVEGDTVFLSLVLACPNCATVRLVSPKTLGVLSHDENGQAVWKTESN